MKIFKRFEPEDANAGQSDELQPLSFIVEEEREKQEALEREAAGQSRIAESGEADDAPQQVRTDEAAEKEPDREPEQETAPKTEDKN